jgi:hypothetical protein
MVIRIVDTVNSTRTKTQCQFGLKIFAHIVRPSVLGKTCKNKLRERYSNYTQISTACIVATDVYKNDKWAQKGCVSPVLPAVCCCRKLEGGDENLPYNKKETG